MAFRTTQNSEVGRGFSLLADFDFFFWLFFCGHFLDKIFGRYYRYLTFLDPVFHHFKPLSLNHARATARKGASGVHAHEGKAYEVRRTDTLT